MDVIRSGRFGLGLAAEGEGLPTLVIGSAVYYPRTFSANLRRHLRMAFVDHRGFAKPDGPVEEGEFAFDTILADIELARRTLGWERMVLLGHSGHAYMALEYAKRHPQHVSHLVMLGAGPSHAAEHMQMAERQWDEAVCPARKARFAADMAALPADIAANPEGRFVAYCVRMPARRWYDVDFDEAPLWRGVHVNLPAFDHLWGEVFRDIDVADGLAELAVPVFLGLGRFDYSVAPAHAWDPYRPLFSDLTLRVFDGSGHTPQLEQPETFDAELLAWLGRSQ